MRKLVTAATALVMIGTACKKDTVPQPVTPAKTVTISWQSAFGGTSSDYARTVLATTDGGYIVAGGTRSTDGDFVTNKGIQDVFIAKYNAAGIRQWHKLIGSTGYDDCRAIISTADGGYILTGQTGGNDGDVSGNHGGDDSWVVKLDAAGNVQWKKCYGGFKSDFTTAVATSPDGGYVLAGISESNDGDVSGNHGKYDAWVFKINSSGALLWQRSLGGSEIDAVNGIVCNADGTIVLGAYTGSNDGDSPGNRGSSDIWIVKLNTDGQTIWSKNYGGAGTDYTLAFSAVPGGYVATGYTTSNNGDITGYRNNGDVYVLKINEAGEKVWLKTIGGENFESAQAITAAPGGSILLTGKTSSRDGDFPVNKGSDDLFAAKLDANGYVLWKKLIGSTNLDEGYGILPVGTDGCIVVGRTYGNDGDVTGNTHPGSGDAWIVRLANQ